MTDQIERLQQALRQIAGKNDLSGVPSDNLESAARNALYECELLAREALDNDLSDGPVAVRADLRCPDLQIPSVAKQAANLAHQIDAALSLVPQSADGVDLAAADMLFLGPQLSDLLREIAESTPIPSQHRGEQ